VSFMTSLLPLRVIAIEAAPTLAKRGLLRIAKKWILPRKHSVIADATFAFTDLLVSADPVAPGSRLIFKNWAQSGSHFMPNEGRLGHFRKRKDTLSY
jgi:hypothetical protein